jgi:signal transduction histidine kinase
MIVVARDGNVAPFCAWAVALLLAITAFCTPVGARDAQTKRVLFLHSFGRDSAPYDATVAAIRAELNRDSSDPIAIYDASLDAGRASEFEVQQSFLELLRRRYADLQPDVVITIGPPAADFFLQNREAIFPGVPVVVAALDVRFVSKSALRSGDIVVASHHDPSAGVDNILRLLPETQKVVVILGDSPLEQVWFGELHKDFAKFADRLAFEFLNELSFVQMRERLATLQPHSVVLYVMLQTDAAGVPHETHAALLGLAQVSAAPIFGFHEAEFGYGVVGGSFQSHQRRAAMTAAAALRTLRGEPSVNPEIQIVDYDPPVYDWRELKRWAIDPARLPTGSEIRFKPPSFWERHRTFIIVAISLFILQAMLLIGLAWQRTRRRRAESEAMTLSGRLITAHEDERRWLARELHDDITQRLAGLAIDSAKLTANDLSPSGLDAQRLIRGGLVQLSEDVHDLSYRLHPSVLDDLGLVEALKAECDRIARSECVRVHIEANGLPLNIPKEIALGIYRIAQEALRNVGRHAKASIVNLSIAASDGGLQLAVTDNGCGFEPESHARRPSLGRASMRERIRLLGGQLDIHSTPGGGTTVLAWVPIPKAKVQS